MYTTIPPPPGHTRRTLRELSVVIAAIVAGWLLVYGLLQLAPFVS